MPPVSGKDIFKTLKAGDPDALRELLQEAPLLVKEVTRKQQTPLHVACDAGDGACAEVLLEGGAAPNARDAEGRTPLHLAVQGNHDDLVPALLQHGADPGVGDGAGLSALHWAARMGYPEIALCLLEPPDGAACRTAGGKRAALLGAFDDEGNTPLHLAASEPASHRLALDFLALLAAEDPALCRRVGALQNKAGLTPLHLACSAGAAEVARRLLEQRADPLGPTAAQESALHLAVQADDVAVLEAVLGCEPSDRSALQQLLTRPDQHGRTPLHLAAAAGNVRMVQGLLAHKDLLDLEAATPAGATAARLAHQGGHTAVRGLLVGHGAVFDAAAATAAPAPLAAAPAKPKGDFSGVGRGGAVAPGAKPAAEAPALPLNPLVLILVVALGFFGAFYVLFVK